MAAYLQRPGVHGDTLLFISEEDIWTTDITQPGAYARRITSHQCVSSAVFSPDGAWIAFSSLINTGTEVSLIQSHGGPTYPVTRNGVGNDVMGWSPDGKGLFVRSREHCTHDDDMELWHIELDLTGATPRVVARLPLGFGTCHSIACQSPSCFVLGRHTIDTPVVTWKGYKGGRAGLLFYTQDAGKTFSPLTIDRLSTTDWPLFVGDTLYVTAEKKDTAAPANLFRVNMETKEAQQVTFHDDFCVRFPHTDGDTIVYQCGGDIHHLDPTTDGPTKLDIKCPRSLTQLTPFQIDTEEELWDMALSERGDFAMLLCRGQVAVLPLWEGPSRVLHLPIDGAFVVTTAFLFDDTVVCVAQCSKDEPYAIFMERPRQKPDDPVHLEMISCEPPITAQPEEFVPHPFAPIVALVTDTTDLIVVDLNATKTTRIDTAEHEEGIFDVAWSAEGRYLAYAYRTSQHTSKIRVYDLKTKTTIDLTPGCYWDESPCFDCDDNYLFFLSCRTYEPVEDDVQLGFSFTQATKIFFIKLRSDAPSLLLAPPRPPYLSSSSSEEWEESESDEYEGDSGDSDWADVEESTFDVDDCPTLDLQLASRRVGCLPVETGLYSDLCITDNNVIMYIRTTPVSELREDGGGDRDDDERSGVLLGFFPKHKKERVLATEVEELVLSQNRKAMLFEDESGLRVARAGKKLRSEDSDGEDIDEDEPGPTSGLLDVDSRIRITVDPTHEAQAMFLQCWLAFKRRFWSADMNGVDWEAIYTRYRPLLDRVCCRSELFDLLSEMLPETRSSHAFVTPSDVETIPDGVLQSSTHGMLGCDCVWSQEHKGFIITHIVEGDTWRSVGGPLAKVDVDVEVGDVIVSVNSRAVTSSLRPSQMLVNAAGQEVLLHIIKGAVDKAELTHIPKRYEFKDATPAVESGGNGNDEGGTGSFSDSEQAANRDRQKRKKKTKKQRRKQREQHQQQQQQQQQRQLQKQGPAKGQPQSAEQAKRRGGRGPRKPRSGRQQAAMVAISAVRVSLVSPHQLLFARYRDWVHSNAARVNALSSDRIGYVHVPDMEEEGYAEFHRYFLMESRKDALIVDIRWNEGGFVSHLLLEKLSRRLLGFEVTRYHGSVRFPEHSLSGPVVLLVDENTCSDGDVLAESFKQLGLGCIVGKRTWGGVVYRDEVDLVDGSKLSIPGCAYRTVTGSSLENRGVAPDMDVDILPHDVAAGRDPQLEAAVQHCLLKLQPQQRQNEEGTA